MRYAALLIVGLLCGCAGGPPHDYYNPAVIGGPKYKGRTTISLVDDVRPETQRLSGEGYTVIGTADYGGNQPKRVELEAQAKRVHANHVIYSLTGVPGQPGSWHFGFNRFGGGGGTDNGYNNVHIVFLGK